MITVESIKLHNPIEDIVERYYELTGRGNVRHPRENPSISVYIDTQSYFDHGGINDGGSVIDWIMHYENLNFSDACQFLSSGITDTTPAPAPRVKISDDTDYTWIKDANLKALTPALALQGLKELYPFIQDATPFQHLLGYSHFHNSLTFEMPNLSINRRTKAGKKWVATSGDKRDYIPYKIDDRSPYVYLYSGMSEVIACEAMGINYIGLQMDSSDRDITETIKRLMKGKTLVVIEENDKSSQKLSQRLKTQFQDVKILRIGANKDYGYDLRDFVNNIGSFEMSQMMLQNLSDMLPLEKREIQDEMIISYDGKYIGNNTQIDISSLDSCVISAITGSGKTHSFKDKSNILILVPRVEQATLGKGDKSDFVINTILTEGAIITYEKFMGHYKANKEFKLYVDSKRFKVVVDEAHMIVAKPSYELIYNLDAVFLSGTIHNSFRSDLQRYKFKPSQPTVLYYTEGKTPHFDDALYFVDKARRLMKTYPKNCIVGAEHKFDNFNIHQHKTGQIFSTSALREGISVNTNTFQACIVIAGHCGLWSVKDIIQGLNRVRGDNVLRVVTKPIQRVKEVFSEHKYFTDLSNRLTDTKEINTIMGEEYSKLIQMTHNVTGSIKSSDYGVACYLAHKTKDEYDSDFYKFEEYDFDEELQLCTYKNEGEEKIEILKHTIGNDIYQYPSNKREPFLRWARHKESGLVDKFMRMTDTKTLHELYTLSRVGQDVKSRYNKIFNRGKEARKYDVDMFYKLLRTTVNIEISFKSEEVIRISKNVDVKKVIVKVISECPIIGVKKMSNNNFKSPYYPIEDIALNCTANPVHSANKLIKVERSKISIKNDVKKVIVKPRIDVKSEYKTVTKYQHDIDTINEEFLDEISEL